MKKKSNYSRSVKPRSNFQKFLLTMKISIVLMFCSILNILALPSYSQTAKISLNLSNSTIEQVLGNFEDQSEFYFLYNQKLVDVTRKVDITADNKPIKDVLDKLFLGDDVSYVIFDRQIILANKAVTFCDSEYTAIRSSISWRITKPLRWLGDRLRGLGTGG